MLNVSTLLGTRQAASDALRYGQHRHGEPTPRSSLTRRPVVVWNSTKACNLACEHCYASATTRPGPDELDHVEARAFLADLAEFGVPAVLLSGGEPLSRPDLLDLAAYGRDIGLRFTLSSNGTLIDADMARTISEVGVTYVGVSIDGARSAHDRLRRQLGAYDGAIEGLRELGEAGVRRGIRFTLTPDTVDELNSVLAVLVEEGIERFCLYHLVPSGRGGQVADITAEARRTALHTVFEFAWDHPDVELLTVDNPSDGPELVDWVSTRDAVTAARAREALAWNRGGRGGPGIGLACVDERGDVHPDQFSRHRTIGNVRERPFSSIWSDPRDEYIAALRSDDRPVPSECRDCPDEPLCGSGLRSRAELATGDPWAFDPSCSRRSSAVLR